MLPGCGVLRLVSMGWPHSAHIGLPLQRDSRRLRMRARAAPLLRRTFTAAFGTRMRAKSIASLSKPTAKRPAGERRGKARRRSPLVVVFSGAAYAGRARCRRRLADGAGFEPAKHEVGCHACPPSKRVPSTARPTIQGDRIRKKPIPDGTGFSDTPITRDSVTRNRVMVQASPASRSSLAWAHAKSSRMFHAQ